MTLKDGYFTARLTISVNSPWQLPAAMQEKSKLVSLKVIRFGFCKMSRLHAACIRNYSPVIAAASVLPPQCCGMLTCGMPFKRWIRGWVGVVLSVAPPFKKQISFTGLNSPFIRLCEPTNLRQTRIKVWSSNKWQCWCSNRLLQCAKIFPLFREQKQKYSSRSMKNVSSASAFWQPAMDEIV